MTSAAIFPPACPETTMNGQSSFLPLSRLIAVTGLNPGNVLSQSTTSHGPFSKAFSKAGMLQTF